ncbi:MAG: SGNH/GDSL hydrolase family protein [Planctomycetes bacterium]|nr:SGNH/GDSL hydrolase family protein [Planctomycetota bacterium]
MLRPRSGETLLFIGDSITECMRQTVAPPLGAGYVQFTHLMLAARHPELELTFVNHGVDGETVLDLERRWERDALQPDPDWLFVMIGVNDVLYRHVGDNAARAVDDATYRTTLERLVARAQHDTRARVVLLEPTPLEQDLASPSHAMMRRVVELVHDVGRAREVAVVPVYERLFAAMAASPARRWMVDVPHPDLCGQAVIALALLEHLGW